MQKRVEPLRDFCEFHPLRLEDLAEQVVAVDELTFVRILKPINILKIRNLEFFCINFSAIVFIKIV